jgi:hypothetical protein
VFREKITGTTADRPQLAKLMKALAPGDVIITRPLTVCRATHPTCWLSPATCSAQGTVSAPWGAYLLRPIPGTLPG